MRSGAVSRVWRRRWLPVVGQFVEEFWNQAGDSGEAIVVYRIVEALRRFAERSTVRNPTVVVRFAAADHDRLGAQAEDVRVRIEGLVTQRAAHFKIPVGTIRVVLERAEPGRAEPFVILSDDPPAPLRTKPFNPQCQPQGSSWTPVLALRLLPECARIPVPMSAIVLGRAVPAPGRLADRRIGRRHCVVRARDDAALLCTDLRSVNGTWVDGSRVTGQTVVRVGQVIRLGRTELLVEPW